MKFYTDLDEFNTKIFFTYNNFYSIYHNLFYLCLLPKNLKFNVLERFTKKTANVFHSILNINEEFCSSMEQCDYILLPPTSVHVKRHEILPYWKSQIILAQKNNKKIIFFLGFDDDEQFNISNDIGYVFRSSGFLSQSSSNVFGLPTVNYDVFKNNFCNKKLSISFCGNYYENTTRKIVIDKFIDKMSKNCDFILRDSWFGNVIGNNYRINKNSQLLELIDYSNMIKYTKSLSGKNSDIESFLHRSYLRFEYFKNLQNNLYCLCVRGGGNFSFRLGETFMMGRIPVLIDTDCILPFRDLIPYDKNCIRVSIENMDNIVDIIHNYHNSHSEDELIQIQKENRLIWEQYFTPENAFFHINNIINNFKN